MNSYTQIIIFSWIIFLAYWFISSLGAKKNLASATSWKSMGFRVGAIILLALLFSNKFPVIHPPSSQALSILGVILCVGGIAFAIWARMHLGKNWGMPMTLKEKPELVTSGPYAFVRHPIYTGVIAAILGSALVTNIFLVIPVLLSCAYFIYSAKTEEKNMIKEFPKDYPQYMKKTKMIIPFIY